MEVFVDSDRWSALEGDPQDLLSAVAVVNQQLKNRGRAILSLRVDGENVPPDDLSAMGTRLLQAIARIEVVSQEVRSVVEEALREIDEVLPELPKACHMLAAVFQGGNPGEGYEPFVQLASIWGTIKSRELQIASLCECSLDEISAGGVPAKRLHDELNGFLREAAGALESGDCVLLGDLLEYELAPRAEAEAQIVAALRKCAESNAVRA